MENHYNTSYLTLWWLFAIGIEHVKQQSNCVTGATPGGLWSLYPTYVDGTHIFIDKDFERPRNSNWRF
jgi:hypothetical protein